MSSIMRYQQKYCSSCTLRVMVYEWVTTNKISMIEVYLFCILLSAISQLLVLQGVEKGE